MLNVVMPSVVMPSVAAPFNKLPTRPTRTMPLNFLNDEEKKSFDKFGTKNPEESCEKPKGVWWVSGLSWAGPAPGPML